MNAHLGLLEACGSALRFGAGLVLVQQSEHFSALVLGQSLGELGDGRGNLEALVQDLALALDLDVTRPFQELGQILLGLHIASDAVRSGGGGAKRVLFADNFGDNFGDLLGGLALALAWHLGRCGGRVRGWGG